MKRLLPLLLMLNALYSILNATWGQSFTAENHNNEYIELSWQGLAGEVSLERRFSFDADWTEIARTQASPFRDEIHRTLCHDTIFYRLSQEETSLLAQAPFTDDHPTTMPTVWLCTVDSLTQRIHLRWQPSADADIQGYILFSQAAGDDRWLPLDTLWDASLTQASVDDSPLQQHHYRLNAFDSCLTASAMTEAIGNLVLRLQATDRERSVSLEWDEYTDRLIRDYTVELVRFTVNGQLPTEYQTAQDAGMEVSLPEEVTRVQATVTANGYGTEQKFRSNTVVAHFSTPEPPTPPQPPSEPEEEVDEASVWIPTAFTPDEVANNRFCLFAEGVTQYHLLIYNRQGLRVFHCTDPSLCWDGRLPSGQPAPQGVYTYALHFTDQNHHTHHQSGSVLLIR